MIKTSLKTGLILAILSASCQGEPKQPERDDNAYDALPKTPPAAENEVTGTYRGYDEINQVVNERLFQKPKALQLKDYIEDRVVVDNVFDLGKTSLKDLLGVFDGDGLRVGMKNGAPNSVNMLLWYMAMDGLAIELANTCDGAKTAHFALTDVAGTIADLTGKLCAWPDPAARDEQTLKDLWSTVMRTDAPETEYQSWKTFVMGPSMTERGAKAVHAMLLAMLYNPHFLLKK